MAINSSAVSKAAKVGGGLAAAASASYGGYYLLTSGNTAISTVSSGEENIKKYSSGAKERLARKGKPFRGKLSTDKYDFYKDFNFPGDCVIKLFPGTETSPIFEWKTSNKVVSTVDEKTIFSGSDQNSAPEFACYSYSDDLTKDQFRLELSIKRKNEGWVWMAGVKKDIVQDQKPIEYKDKLWFREFYLTSKDQKTWNVELGQEGEIVETEHAYDIELPYNWKSEDGYWDIDPETDDPCLLCTNTKLKINKSFYWKPNSSSSYKLRDISSNLDRQVTRFANNSDHVAYIKKGRTMIYKDGLWWPYDYKNTEAQNKSLFKFEDTKAANLKGNWRDLNTLCYDKKREREEAEAFNVFCK